MDVLRKEACPACRKKGMDTKGDNLAVYKDHSFCYSCHYVEWPRLTAEQLEQKIKMSSATPQPTQEGLRSSNDTEIASNSALSYKKQPPDFSSENFTAVLPAPARLWLAGYGITPEEEKKHHLVYDLERDWLVFPWFLPYRDSPACVAARNFDTKKNSSRWYSFRYKKTYWPFVKNPNAKAILVVEDSVSAIKAARVASTVCLLGSHIPPELFLSFLSQALPVRLWLDRDKAWAATKFTQQALTLGLNCGTIVTPKDPKEYSTSEIKATLDESLSSNTEGIS